MGASILAEVVDLDDDVATASAVGAKAARLAAARRAGLPVLPGVVVLAGPGRRLVHELLPDVPRKGPHAMSLALMEAVATRVEFADVRARAAALGASLVARSSSGVEDDPLWSGAFSSFLDVDPEQLATAVAGCWASTLTPSVLDLCEKAGVVPEDVCPAVLIQPMVSPDAAGTATYVPGEPVEVIAVWGSPAPLLAGWAEGWSATVQAGRVEGPAVGGPPSPGYRMHPIDRPLPADWLVAVADLAVAACDGEPAAIEWAIVDGNALLLQARPTVPRTNARPEQGAGGVHTSPAGAGTADDGLLERLLGDGAADGRAAAVAWSATRYGGPLGDELVLPWLLALDGTPPTAPDVDATEPPLRLGALRDKFDEAVEAGTALGAAALGCAVAELPLAAAQLLGRVAGGALDMLDGLHAVDATSALGVLAAFDATGRALVAAGALAHREQLWGLSATNVRAMLELPSPGGWQGQRHRILRWQPLMQAVIRAQGHLSGGDGVSPGAGAGVARRISTSADLRRVVPGDVVVLRRPSPQLAPALWVAAGLVAESGSGAAHLVEVARSLRVPAVVAVGPVAATDGEDLVLVDGDRHEVAVLHMARRGPSRAVGRG